MQVYFISSGYYGCFYVRCLMPLIAGGWNGSKTSLRAAEPTQEEMYKGCMNADIVVFQRPMERNRIEVAKLLKQAGKKIVMDNDDTYLKGGGVLDKVLQFTKEEVQQKQQKLDDLLKEFASLADLVTVSTEPLAKEYAEVNPNTVVLPNCVDPDDWEEPLRNETDIIRIGLVGSVVSDRDYKPIQTLIEDLLKSPKIKLVVFGLPPKRADTVLAQEVFKDDLDFWLSKNVEWQPFVQIADYNETLNNLRLDMMLIPRQEDYFNRCKSNLKFLEASMLEIPVIAQGFTTGDSPYQGKDSKYMEVCTTREEWAKSVTKLVADKKLRRSMGKKAKKYVLANYTIENNIHLWKKAYEGING